MMIFLFIGYHTYSKMLPADVFINIICVMQANNVRVLAPPNYDFSRFTCEK